MNRFLLILVCLFTVLITQAQGGGGVKNGLKGGHPPGGGNGMDERGERPGKPNTQIKNPASGNFFNVELKDGTKISGSGSVKIKNGVSILQIKNADGKEFSYGANQVSRLSRVNHGGIEDFINFEDKYWLSKINKNVEQFYQVEGNDELAFIKEKDKFRAATKEDIIDLVKEDKDAYKQAKKGHIKKSLLTYIGVSQPQSNEFREMRQNLDAQKNQPLFNQ